MAAASIPPDEQARLLALRALDIVDTPATEVFDSFVRAARLLFGTASCGISFVETDRQWFKASVGLDVKQTARDIAFCSHAILKPDAVMCVPDALQDRRFAENPLVLGSPHIRFYAGAPILAEGGQPVGSLCVIDPHPQEPTVAQLDGLRDLAVGVSAAVRLHGLARQLEHDARCDPLTGLGNRTAFDAMLERLAPAGVMLLLLDLDKFKSINDHFGHRGGDLALQETARRLGGGAWHAFRLGGDEFALLAPRIDSVASRLAVAQTVHAALADTFLIDGETVTLRTSIGVAGLPGAANTPAELLHHADVALYRAKHAGGGLSRHAAPPSHTGPTISARPEASLPAPDLHGLGRIDLVGRLRRALLPPGAEPFRLAFQPVMSLATGQPASLEALVRWNVAGHGPVPPSEFVVLAERLGLVFHLDRWVLAAACRTAVGWPEPWPVSVNISAASFGLIDVPALVRDALDTTGLPPDRLVIEMTETALASEPLRARQAVEALRHAGVGVALDDFGGGHGSLTTLRTFPFSELKMDRSLIQGLCTDATQEHLVRLVADLGRRLSVDVVAEGVETPEELRAVARLGVTLAQGHLFGRASTDADLPDVVEHAWRQMRASLPAAASRLLEIDCGSLTSS